MLKLAIIIREYYAADPEKLPEEHRERDSAPRKRKSLAEFVFSGK